MTNWGSKLAVAAFMPLMVLLAAGCEEKVLKSDYDKLDINNKKLQADLDRSKDAQTQLETDKQGLLAKLSAQDLVIQDLRNQKTPVVPVRPPVVVTPPPGPGAPEWVDDEFGPGTRTTRTAGLMTVDVEGDVLFASGQAALLPSSLATLDRIASKLKSKYGSNKIRVIGHTDNDPIVKSHWASNMELSTARAQKVADYLATRGLKNLEVSGAGSAEPRQVPEKTKEDKAHNRRVSVQVVLAKP